MRPVKAAVYYQTGPPDVVRYEDVADPVVYPAGVLIEVEAISIEGGDTLNRAGGMMTSTPHIVGYQCAGTIREVGADVSDRHVGQRVVATMLSGSHAELAVVPAMLTWIIRMAPTSSPPPACRSPSVRPMTASSNSAIYEPARPSSSRREREASAWPPFRWRSAPERL